MTPTGFRFQFGAAVLLFAACGATPSAGEANAAPLPPSPGADSASPQEAAPEASPDERPADIPPEAVEIQNGDKGKLWVLKRDNGTLMVFERTSDDLLAGTAGPASAFPDIYPDADFSQFLETAPDTAK